MSLSLFSSKTKNNDVFVDDNVRVSILMAHVPGRVGLDFIGSNDNDGDDDGMTHDVTTLFRLRKSDAE